MTSFLRQYTLFISLVLMLGLSACAQSPEELMVSAQDAESKGDYRTASIHLRNLLQAAPDSIEARLMLGEIALRTGDIQSAEKELKRARDLGADSRQVSGLLIEALFAVKKYQEVVDEIDGMQLTQAEMPVSVLLLQAYSYQRLGRLRIAEQSFTAAIDHYPDLPEGYAALSELMMTTGQFDRADALIDDALARDADYLPAHLLKGRRLLTTAGPEAALDVFTQSAALAAEKGDTSSLLHALTLAGDIQLSLRRLDEAAVTITDIEKIAPARLLTRYLRARLYAQSDENAEAVGVLQGLVRDFPDFRPARALLAAIHLIEGNLEQAESHLTIVAQADPGNIVVSRMLAEVRLRQGRADQISGTLGSSPGSDQDRVNQELLILAGQSSLKEGDIETALGYFQQGQAVFPEDTRFLLGEVTSYMSQGEPEKAKALLKSLQAQETNTQAVFLLSVLVHLQEEEYDLAVAKAEELVASQDPAEWANQFLGAVYFAAGRNEQARSQLEAVLKSDPDNVGAMIGMARIEARAGSTSNARTWLEKIRRGHAGNIVARIMLAKSYLEEGDGRKAFDVAREAALKAPDQIQPANLQATAAALLGEWDEAIAGFRHVVELSPENPAALLNLARAYFQIGDEESSQATIDRAAEIAPNDPRVLMIVGEREMASGEFSRAAETFRRVYEILPNGNAAIWIYRARTAASKKEPMEYLDLWLTARPDDAASRYFRAAVLQEKGQQQEAIAEYRRVLELEPEQPLALNNLAWLYFETGDSRAQSVADRALAVRPDWAAITDTAGWIYLKNGDLSRGLELLAKSVEQSKGDPEILYHFAVAQNENGMPEAAVITLNRALRQEGVFLSRPDAQALRDELNR